RRKFIMLRQLAIYFRGRLVRAAELALDEAQHRHAFERGAPLAAADDRLDRRRRAGRRLGAVSLLARDAALLEELQHDVDVRPRAGKLLHEVFQHRAHEAVLFGGYRVDGDIAEENRIGAHAQIMLDLAKDNLLARPAMLEDALKPRMLAHGRLVGVAPKLADEFIGGHKIKM